MKFISVRYNKTNNSTLVDMKPEIYTIPDTALHINKRPFFIPDFASPCLLHVRRAIHLCRLGRCISEQFAHRYYDGITLCAHFEACSMPPAIGLCFDDCLTVGEWQEGTMEDAAKAIAEASKYYTMRQGDIILLDDIRNAEEVKIDQHIDETLNGSQVLSFNIK